MQKNNSKGQMTAQIDLGGHVKSGFDWTYPFDSTGRLGRINNTRCMHVNPADSIKGQSFAQVQFEPLAVPILNNMHVKQEHFYVTKNSVWENFDDFISGGEDMQYDGKVPSLSLAQMWQKWYDNVLADDNYLPLVSIPFVSVVQGTWNTATEVVTLAIPEAEIRDNFVNYSNTNTLKDYLESIQMLDLFNHLEPLHHAAGAFMLAQLDAGINVFEYNSQRYLKLFDYGYFNQDEMPTQVGADETLEHYWGSLNPNKYIRQIYKSIKEFFVELQISSLGGRMSVIPTSSMLGLLEYSYQVIRPFFGVTSYLDQMGYNKFKFVDWLYLYCLNAGSRSISAANTSYTITPNRTDMSDSPQEILSLRAQYCIWWNNYRDQLLETDAPRPRKTDDITDEELFCLLAPRVRCWHKDTFTTALDSAGTVNGVVPTSNSKHVTATMLSRAIQGLGADEVSRTDKAVYEISLAGSEHTFRIPTGFISGMHGDVNDLTATTTNYFSLDMLDAAKRAQKWLRKSIFYGNRIQDFLFTRFGVKYLDARLRLPELLSTSSTMAKIDAVVNNTTVVTDKSSSIAGDRSAIAYSTDKEPGYFSRYCEEHGFIISNLTIMPDAAYTDIFDKVHSELDQFDYPFEEFATLGLDAVYDVELSQLPVKVYDGNVFSSQPIVFGYQGRYYNYKAHHGEIHGELLDTQDAYVFGRKFNIYDPDSRPKLNYIFVHCHPFLGMFVVDNEWSDYFRYNIMHAYDVDRLLPVHSLYL